jgi:hypothetical protein
MNHAIDMSRLKRRAPDLKNVGKPRFLFPGWSIKNPDGTLGTETNWDRSSVAVLTRTHTTLNIFWDHDHLAWALRGPAMRKGVRHDVLFISDAAFEDAVKAAEQYLLLAHEKYESVVDVPSGRTTVQYFDACMDEWRHPDGL